MKQFCRWICLILAALMLLSLVPMVRGASHPFLDVEAGSWYESGVEYCYANGLVSGTGDTAFSPNVNMTRAMVVTVLYSMDGKPQVTGACPFADVESGAWYAPGVEWAYENGIVSGMSATAFAPDQDITREQLVAIFYQYALYAGLDVSTGEGAEVLGYDDADQISAWAVTPMQWACGEGLVSGMGDGTLAPKGTATRAQCATILHKFHRMLTQEPEIPETTAPPEETTAPTEASLPPETTLPAETTLPPETAHQHSWSDWAVTSEATADAKGSEKRICATCGAAEIRQIETLPAETETVPAETVPTDTAPAETEIPN